MANNVSLFYDDLADYYDLIFEDWNRSIDRQAKVLNRILSEHVGQSCINLLDCACGIGTQAIGFAKAGHQVVGSDLSRAAVGRAEREAKQRGLDVSFFTSDMTSLKEVTQSEFDVVAALDNALPHLTTTHLDQALTAIRSKLKRNGIFIASIRDYDRLVLNRPTAQPPAFYGTNGSRRIVHQVWDWVGDHYTVHLHITVQSGDSWICRHFVSEYQCLLRGELTAALGKAGFEQVQWLPPEDSNFYQPIVIAKNGS